MKEDKYRKLFDAIGGIGDDLIDEASSYDAKRERARKIRKFSAIAASFVLVAAIALIAVLSIMNNKNKI